MSDTQGFTRASALGPISTFVETCGGSIDRVFRRADLPLSILEHPDLLLPLREQFKVLSEAGREIGDPYFGAQLGRHCRIKNLSGFGTWVCNAPTLASAIDRANRGLNRYLQTATNLRLCVIDETARWSIEFLDRGNDGRFQNELLGVSYLIDSVRMFAGRSWNPTIIRTTCVGDKQAAALEKIFQTPVLKGAEVSAIDFDMTLLAVKGNRQLEMRLDAEPPIPSKSESIEVVSVLSTIALLEGYPKIDWVASKIGVSRRTLQRRLSMEEANFSGVLEGLLKDRAAALLMTTDNRITDIALQLGYSDPAHFTRAFRRWTGMAPAHYRSMERQL